MAHHTKQIRRQCIILKSFGFIVYLDNSYRNSLQTALTGKSLYFYSKKLREQTCHKKLNMLVSCKCHIYSVICIALSGISFFFFSCFFLFDHVIRDKHICLCCITKGWKTFWRRIIPKLSTYRGTLCICFSFSQSRPQFSVWWEAPRHWIVHFRAKQEILLQNIYCISYTPLPVIIREHFDCLFVHLNIVNCIIHKYISGSVQHLYFVSGRP